MRLIGVRKEEELATRAQMKASTKAIEDRLAAHVASLRLQVQGDSPIAIERKRVEGLIKDIYYADEQNAKKEMPKERRPRSRPFSTHSLPKTSQSSGSQN